MPNTLVSWYRQAFPQQAAGLSDDQITLQYAGQAEQLKADHGVDIFQSYPDFRTDYDRLRDESTRATLTPYDYGKQVFGGLTGGAVRLLGEIPQGAADIASYVTSGDVDLRGVAQRATEGLADIVSPDIDPEKKRVLDKSFLAHDVPEAFGSTLGFLALGGVGGIAGRALGLSGRAAQIASVAGSGAAVQFADTYQDAIRHGATEEQAIGAAGLAAPVGATEVVPIASWLSKIDRVVPGAKRTLVSRLLDLGKREAIKGAILKSGEEFIQEGGQSAATDLIAKTLYDRDRPLFEDLATQASAGGVSGLLFEILTSSLGGKHVQTPAAATQAAPPSAEAQAPATPSVATPAAEVPPVENPVAEVATLLHQVDHAAIRDLVDRTIKGDEVTAEVVNLSPDAKALYIGILRDESAKAVQAKPQNETQENKVEETGRVPSEQGQPTETVPAQEAQVGAPLGQGQGQEVGTSSFASLGAGAGAAVGNMYDGMFAALEKGTDRWAGLKDPALTKALPLYKSGQIKSADDLREWANLGQPEDLFAARKALNVTAQPETPGSVVAPAGELTAAPGTANQVVESPAQEAAPPKAVVPAAKSILGQRAEALDEAGKAAFSGAVVATVGNFNQGHNAEQNRKYLEGDLSAITDQEAGLAKAAIEIGNEIEKLDSKKPGTDEEDAANNKRRDELLNQGERIKDVLTKLATLKGNTSQAIASFQAENATSDGAITPAAVEAEYGLSDVTVADRGTKAGITKLPGYYETGDTAAGEELSAQVTAYHGAADEVARDAAAQRIGQILTSQATVKGASSSLTRRVTAWKSRTGQVVLTGSYRRTAKKGETNKEFVFSVAPTAKPGQSGSNIGIRDMLDAGFQPMASMLLRSPRKQIARLVPSVTMYQSEFGPLKQARADAFRYTSTAQARPTAESADKEQYEFSEPTEVGIETGLDAQEKLIADEWFSDNPDLLVEVGEWRIANPKADTQAALAVFQGKIQKSVETTITDPEKQAELVATVGDHLLRYADIYATRKKKHAGQTATSEGRAVAQAAPGGEGLRDNDGVIDIQGAGQVPQAAAESQGGSAGTDQASASAAPGAPVDQDNVLSVLEYIGDLEKEGKLPASTAADLRTQLDRAQDDDDVERVSDLARVASTPDRSRLRDPDAPPDIDWATGQIRYPELLPDSPESVASNILRLRPAPRPSPSRRGLLGLMTLSAIQRKYENIRLALAEIASDYQADRGQRDLASALSKAIHLTGVTLRFSSQGGNRAGYYSSKTNEIVINPDVHRDEQDLQTSILHEVFHAYTTRLRLRSGSALSEEEREFLSRVQQLQSIAASHGVSWQESASPDPNIVADEFQAAWSDPAFRAKLAEIPVPATLGMPTAKNLWEAIKQAVGQIYQYVMQVAGVRNRQTTALDSAMALVQDMTDRYAEIQGSEHAVRVARQGSQAPVETKDAIRSKIVEGLFGDEVDISRNPGAYGFDATNSAARMMATTNEMGDTMDRMMNAYMRQGGNRTTTGQTALNPVQFVSAMFGSLFRGVQSQPDEVRKGINSAMAAAGLTQISAATRTSDLEQHSEAPKSARDSLVQHQKLQARMAAQIKVIRTTFGQRNILARIAQLSTDLADVTKRYTDLTVLQREFTKELRRTYDESEDHGAASILKSLGVSRGRKAAIQAAVTSIQGNISGYSDALQALSDLGIDFSRMKAPAASGQRITAADIQRQVNASTDPALVMFQTDAAKLSIALQLARRRAIVMDLMSARRAGPERTTLDRVIELATSDRDDAFDLAQAELPRLKNLGALGQRVINRLRETKTKHRQLLDMAQRYAEWEAFHMAASPELAAKIQTLERQLQIEGHSVDVRQWAAVDGAVYFVPDSTTQSEEELFSNSNNNDSRKVLNLGDGKYNYGEVEAQRQKMGGWLKANKTKAGTPNYELMVRMVDQLAKVQADSAERQLQRGAGGTVMRYMGDIASRLEFLSNHPAREAAKMIRKFASLYENNLRTTDQKAFHTFGGLFQEAMSATGIDHPELFQQRFYDRAFGYLESRQDLLDSKATPEAQIDRAMREVRLFLTDPDPAIGDPDLAKPGAWEAVERLLRQAVICTNSLQATRRHMNLKIREELTDGKVIFREVIGSPAFTMSRTVSKRIKGVVDIMKDPAAWGSLFTTVGGVKVETMTKSNMKDLFNDPSRQADLAALLAARFTPKVMEEFVKPLAYKTGKTNFDGPEIGGVVDKAERDNLIGAFDVAMANGGGILDFILELHTLEGGTPDTLPDFVGGTLKTFQHYFDQLHKIADTKNETSIDDSGEIGRSFLDARQGEDFPAEWLSYRTYNRADHMRYVRILASQAAYGDGSRDIEANLDAAYIQLNKLVGEFREANALAQAGDLAGAKQKLNAGGLKRARENAPKNLLALGEKSKPGAGTLRATFEALNRTLRGAPQDEKMFTQTVGLMSYFTVQGMTTAGTDTISMIEAPFRKFGFGLPAAMFVARSAKNYAIEAIGTLFQAVNLHLAFSAAHQQYTRTLNTMGFADIDSLTKSRGYKSLIERYKEELGDEMTMAALWRTYRLSSRPLNVGGLIGGAVTRINKAAKVGLEAGIGVAKDPEKGYASLKILAPFSANNIWMGRACVRTWLETVDEAIAQASTYMKSHPQALADPNFLFTADTFAENNPGYSGVRLNMRSFAYLNETLQRHGIHLEEAARRRLRGDDSLTRDQLGSVVALGNEEITLNSSITTRPAWSITDTSGRIASPLIGWSIAKMPDLLKSTLDPQYKFGVKALGSAVTAMLLAVLPAALLYAFLRREYEEEVVGKAPNILPLQLDSTLPLALLDNLGRIGTFGIAGDVANSIFNVSTNREFSVDSRVFFLNSMTSLSKTLSTFIGQDGTATYQSVWRPFIQSMGGSGYLQNFDAINNTLGMDNAERRVVRRINVSNLLRVAGRIDKLDVRVFRGGSSSIPNPVKPYVGNMALAALANDPIAFRTAYQAALEAAAKEYADDPKVDPYEKVGTAYESLHPLRSVFKQQPTKREYQQLLTTLGDDGEEVSEAIRYFNSYGTQVLKGRGKTGLTPYFGVERRNGESASPTNYRRFVTGFSPASYTSDYRAFATGL